MYRVLKVMERTLKMLDYVLKMMDYALKIGCELPTPVAADLSASASFFLTSWFLELISSCPNL